VQKVNADWQLQNKLNFCVTFCHVQVPWKICQQSDKTICECLFSQQ